MRGTIDFRMVSTIIARTENVEDEFIADLDEAIAGHRREVDETVQTEVAGSASICG